MQSLLSAVGNSLVPCGCAAAAARAWSDLGFMPLSLVPAQKREMICRKDRLDLTLISFNLTFAGS